MTATARIAMPAPAGAPSSPRVPTLARGDAGREAMAMRMWVTALTARGAVVTDGEGSVVWRLEPAGFAAIADALAVGITAVDFLGDGRARIAGTEISVA
ncbi:hypothetical protein [uncultured Demequina sp.]|mgnify:CR=1 FL=1|uniref:hypothetical protein n=1 Tax=uncultured Demequina sp. TaxID=693499 RepID=UPI0025DCB8F1|nr:hypothetical protein [uncultured Demequina sp.]